MKHFKTYMTLVLVIMLTALAASCSASGFAPGVNDPADTQDLSGAADAAGTQFDQDQFPGIPGDVDGAGEEVALQAKSASWVGHPNHLAPLVSFLGAVDPVDPGCYLLKGLKGGITGATNRPQIAYAIYKIHLGALEPDLLDMKVAAQIDAPGEQYFAAIANFSALTWQFYGPLNAPSWDTDMTTLGYDFTSPAGDLYIGLIALPGEGLHITDITLNFKDREKPKIWNVFGQAFEKYSAGIPHAGYDVIFEDIVTGTTFTTVTATDGRWGMNLPTGEYNFMVVANEMLLDVAGPVVTIDFLPAGVGTRLDLDSTGQIIYQGTNAAYTGSVVPMPLITANQI